MDGSFCIASVVMLLSKHQYSTPLSGGRDVYKRQDQRPAAAAAFAFSLRRFFVDIQGHGRAPGCPFQEGNGKTQHGKENPKFFFPDYRSRSRFPRPTAITAVSLRSGGKGVLKERCTGRDVTPVLCRYLFSRTRNALQTRCV